MVFKLYLDVLIQNFFLFNFSVACELFGIIVA